MGTKLRRRKVYGVETKVEIGSLVIVYSIKDMRTLEKGEYKLISQTETIVVGTEGYLSHKHTYPSVLQRIA